VRLVRTSVDGIVPYDPTHLARYRAERSLNLGALQAGWYVSRCQECGRIDPWFLLQRPAYAWQAFYRWELWLGPLYVRWYA
jgi:hypothetical protein